MQLNFDAEDIDAFDYVDEISSSSFTDLMDAIKDSSHWPDWCESMNMISIDDIDDAEEVIKQIDEIHPLAIRNYIGNFGYTKLDAEEMLDTLMLNHKDFMLEKAYKYFSPAEIFEWLVLFYPSYLRLNKDQGGDREYISKMSHTYLTHTSIPPDLDGHTLWNHLCQLHPEFLSSKIGELILRGNKDGNT